MSIYFIFILIEQRPYILAPAQTAHKKNCYLEKYTLMLELKI